MIGGPRRRAPERLERWLRALPAALLVLMGIAILASLRPASVRTGPGAGGRSDRPMASLGRGTVEVPPGSVGFEILRAPGRVRIASDDGLTLEHPRLERAIALYLQGHLASLHAGEPASLTFQPSPRSARGRPAGDDAAPLLWDLGYAEVQRGPETWFAAASGGFGAEARTSEDLKLKLARAIAIEISRLFAEAAGA